MRMTCPGRECAGVPEKPKGSPMKTLRRSLLALTLALGMAACGPSITGPHTPDSGNHTPDSGNHTPDSGNHTPDSGNHTPDSGN